MTKAIVTLIIISLFVSSGFFWRQKIQELVRFGLAQISSSPEQKLVTETREEVEEEEPEIEEKETTTELVLKLQLALTELQERLDNLEEEIDTLNQELERLKAEEKEIEEIEKELEEEKQPKKEEAEEEELEEEVGQEVGQTVCQKLLGSLPVRNMVILNEVAWMGTVNSANDEWIELKNKLSSPINLTGWQLLDKDGQIKIIFSSQAIIPPNGFFLLERTNDDSVPGLKADLIYNGNLSNSEEALFLFDENCLLQDEVEANPDWPAGDNSAKRTMERKLDFGWQSSFSPGGTPKRENSSGYAESYFGAIASPSLPSYPKILISEIQIAGQDTEGKIMEKEDFVELFNPNDQDISLTGWYLQRKTKDAIDFSSYAPQNLFSGKVIKAHNHFLIANASSTFLAEVTTTYPLTEDNTLVLKNPNREIADKVGWGEAPDYETATTSNPAAGESIGRRWSTTTENYQDTDNNFEDFEIQVPTPKEKNKSKNKIPMAIFTFSPPNPFVDEEIIFDASSSTDPDGQISTFVWNFGDGATTSTNQTTTTHSFSTSSDFLISLIVVDDENTTSTSATTTINVSFLQPILEVSTTTLSFFGQEYGENSPNQTFSIINSGQGDLNWTASTSANWLLVSSATGTVPTASSATIEVLINVFGLVAGNYDATITIEASGAQKSPKEISVSLTIFPETVKTVIINEIAWMGTKANSNDEWIELYNNTTSTINLTGWVLKTIDGSPNIIFDNLSIPVQDFFLLERTDDTTVSDIQADLIYTGALENNGEKLELRDNIGILIDMVDCSQAWFAGKASPDYISMERINSNDSGNNPENWANNNLIIKNGQDAEGNQIIGTPKAKNSVSL